MLNILGTDALEPASTTSFFFFNATKLVIKALKAIDGIAAVDPSNQFGYYSEEKKVESELCFKFSL